MPNYRVRYVCETSVQSEQNIALRFREKVISFLFSQKNDKDNAVRALVDIEGENHRDAGAKAQTFLQPCMDALAFATGTPLLVQHWDFIIKDESGNKTRRAIWCEKRSEPAPLRLTQQAFNEAQKILSTGESSLELCWHRYALQRNLILDRFVFQWLALEALSGKRQIRTICPRCKTEITHCDKPLSHEGADGTRAYELFSRVETACSRQEFMRDIWGKTRNSVFHGTKYPSSELLARLRDLSPKLRRACDLEFNGRYQLGDHPRPVQDLEFHVYRTNMFEWQTANADVPFADDFPWEAVNKEFGNMEPGEVRAGSPFKLLNFQKESENW